jgi:DNA-binding GntR family transcriptional regulator
MKRAVTSEREGSESTGGARTIAEWVYGRLRDDIVYLRLEPDQPLRFDFLRGRYGVGVSPLREALTRLASERLVFSLGQRGFRVAPISAGEARDLVRARILVESEALKQSINRGDLGWESALNAAYWRLSRTPVPRGDAEGNREWSEAHRAFHRALLSACESPWLLTFADLLFDQAERYRLVRVVRTPSVSLTRDVTAEHQDLLDATLSRDCERAKRALALHYTRTLNAVTEALTRPARRFRKPVPARSGTRVGA